MSDDSLNVDVSDIWISLSCSIAVLAVVSLSYKFLQLNRGWNFKIHALYWTIAIITVVLLPSDVSSYVFTGLTITLVGAIYPIYRAVKACCTPYEGDDKEWLQFWVVGGILFMMTTWVDDAIDNEYVKGVWLGCLLFTFFWLYFPLTCGALLVYDGNTVPFLGPHCPRRLLGHWGAWLEGRFSNMNKRNEITIKYGFENYELNLN